MRKLAILTLVATVGFSGTATAQAKIAKPIKCHEKMELRTLERCQSHAVKYAETVVGFWRNNPHIFKGTTPRIVHKEYARLKWLRRELAQTRKKLQPRIPHLSAWKCIHGHEGAWNDPNAPYYGGLQMDMDFMKDYGPELLASKGTADNWTPYEQMMVAERAYRSRGFYPWPKTARYCGLI